MDPYVHETAVVDDHVEIGSGTRVWHFVHVSSHARVGRNCVLGQNVFIGRGVHIGDRVRVQNNVSIYEGVEVEDDVFLGPGCVFTNVVNPRAFIERSHDFLDTYVRRGVTIGANATIVCGHELAEYSFVGAGAVVTHDVAAYSLVVGNPARHVGYMCRCGERLPVVEQPGCEACGERYEMTAKGIVRIEV